MLRKVFCIAVVIICIGLSCIVFAGERETRDGTALDPGTPSPPGGPLQAQPAGKTLEDGKSPDHKAEEKRVIVARVNGVPVTLKSVVDMMNHLSTQKRHAAQTPEEKEALRKEALDRLILEELAYQKAKTEGLKAEPVEVDRRVANLKEKLGGEEEFRKKLETEQMTEEELRADIGRSIVLQSIFKREVYDKVVVPREDIEKAYEKDKGMFLKPEKIVVIDVVFFLYPEDPESIEKAENILKKILDDKDKNPRNLVPDGTFIVYDAEIKKDRQRELYEKARELKVGELSGVVATPDSLHIIKIKEYSPEKQFTLEEVKGYVEGKLRSDARRKLLQEWDADLRKGADVEILDAGEGKQLPVNSE